MRQGADRAALNERKDDLYETPYCAIETLLRHEVLPQTIWEPCAGRGAIAEPLRQSGRLVRAFDLVAYSGAVGIQPGVDFLMERAAAADTIVTNFPFKLNDECIDHGLELGCRVIALCRLMFMEAVDGRQRGTGLRSKLIDRHLSHVWLGRERLPMMHREGWEGPKHSNSGAPFAWFVFEPLPHPPQQGYVVRRVSWWAK